MDQSIRLRRPDEIEPDESHFEYHRQVQFVFSTSSSNALKADMGDRRFAVIDFDDQEKRP